MKPDRAAVCVLARAPSAAGKTRLTEGLSAERARALRRALLLDTIESACASGFPLVVCYTPTMAHAEFEGLAIEPPPSLVAQQHGDLGTRMRAAFDACFARGFDRVVLIGSDLPTLPPAHIVDAVAALDRVPAVIGPAEDGGYYLLGLRGPHPELFDGIEWGTGRVLADTYAAARAAAVPIESVAIWHDVDSPDDLRRVVSSDRAAHTRGWLMSS